LHHCSPAPAASFRRARQRCNRDTKEKKMKMRHGLIAAIISLASLALVSLAGCSEQAEEAPAKTSAPAPAAATPPAPVVIKPASATPAPATPESDAVALSEETVDKVEAEKNELAARAADLKTQVEDGEMIIAMKAKQIKDLEAQLKQGKTESKK
jgi:hypothetical protein